MIRIGIVGVPGAGKTSLARSVTSKCRTLDKLNRVELVSEYARRYISKHGSIGEIWEQYRIMEKQIEWEDSIPADHTDIMITDSPVHLTFMYAAELSTNKPKDIMIYNDIFKKMSKLNEGKPRYDIIFHLPPVITPVKDGVRPDLHFDQGWREEADYKIKLLFTMLFKPAKFLTINDVNMDYRTNYCIEAVSMLLNKV